MREACRTSAASAPLAFLAGVGRRLGGAVSPPLGRAAEACGVGGALVRGRPVAEEAGECSPRQPGRMFQITTLSDSSVRVPPPSLSKPTLEAVTEELENSYVDRVVEDVGLVVTLYEIHSVEGGDVYPGDGGAHFAVTFSVVVFCPFEGEVLVGKLKSCDEHGLKISLGFFDDVHVPESSLQEPSVLCVPLPGPRRRPHGGPS